MSIIGIGTDIVSIQRMQKIVERHGARFAEKTLHPEELVIFNTAVNPVPYLAKRFAAKESVAKALGTGIGKHVHLQEIQTCNDERGKPYLKCHGATQQFMQNLGVVESFISLSDEKNYAVAYVILTGR